MSLRELPSIDRLLRDPRLSALPHAVALDAARQAVDRARETIRAGGEPSDDLAADAAALAVTSRRARLRRVINATGVVVHTNLGRAPFAPEVAEAVAEVAAGYSNVELQLEGPSAGRRGGRLDGLTKSVAALTGAEDAIAVNNCAAAVLLALTVMARGRSVLVSRGELVEIGGSFRVPDVVAAGGARLVEVGTTNRTRVADFAAALDADVAGEIAVILRVHPSNFRVSGFTERPERDALVALGRARGVPVVEDLGSGLLGIGGPQDPALGGGPWPGDEETLDGVLAAGVDLVCCSGDKLLGGPQAGLVVGRADLVRQLRAHPMYRALRLDKLALIALEATLRMYREGRAADVPVRAMLALSADQIRPTAERIAADVPGATVEEDLGYSGGGALPGRGLPTWVIAVRGPAPDALLAALRAGDPPVVARVARDAVLVDPRTLLPGEDEIVIGALRRAIDAVGR